MTGSLGDVRRGRPPPAPVLRRLQTAREQLASQPALARVTVEGVLRDAPGYADAVRLLGMAAQATDDVATAARCFAGVLRVWPDDADLHLGLGIALFELGDRTAGVRELRQACTLAPQSANAWFNLGCALKKTTQIEEAFESFDHAAALTSSHLGVRLERARTLVLLGRIDEAITGFRDVLRREPGNAEAWFALSNLNTRRLSVKDTGAIRAAYATTRDGMTAHELLGFALAKALEDQGDYAAAFNQFAVANAEKRKTLTWDGPANRRYAESIRAAFDDPVTTALDTGLGREVTFIASIPRSGSTLVEQILASHPEVAGANEIDDLWTVVMAESKRRHKAFPTWISLATASDWQRLGETYLARTARWRAHKPRFTDKGLVTWRLAGAALAMLPAARVVIVRRDPLETCLACFRQRFGGESGFTYDLDEMADYCIDFVRLTDFWLQKYPRRVFDLKYELLVAEPESTIRRLLDFCGLSFHPHCLEFHKTQRAVLSSTSAAEVREPIHRDTARADRYGTKLDPLRERLRRGGLVF